MSEIQMSMSKGSGRPVIMKDGVRTEISEIGVTDDPSSSPIANDSAISLLDDDDDLILDTDESFGLILEEQKHHKLSTRQLAALTCCVGALQIVWSTIFSHGSSYLLFLGISKSQSSLIWGSAPLCGTIIHPLFGAIGDRNRSSWGRRRPLIVAGAAAIVLSLTTVAWVQPVVLLWFSLFGISSEHEPVAVRWAAAICIVILSFSIQPFQSGVRSLMVDVCPPEQQSLASGWAGRFSFAGNICGYIIGSIPLPLSLGDQEAWRYRIMSFASVLSIMVATVITCNSFHETKSEDKKEAGSIIAHVLRDVIRGVRKMPPKAWKVCKIQFVAWMGWFGFLFYSTSYIGGLYVEESIRKGVEASTALQDEGMRRGTMGSLLFAIMALIAALVSPTIGKSMDAPNYKRKTGPSSWIQFLRRIDVFWTCGYVLFAICTFSTIAISSSTVGIIVIAVAGFAFGVCNWAPFALMGEAVAVRPAGLSTSPGEGGKSWETNRRGAMMGIHNAAISLPQIIAAIISSFIFWAAQRMEMKDGVNWVMRASGIAGAVAAWCTFRAFA